MALSLACNGGVFGGEIAFFVWFCGVTTLCALTGLLFFPRSGGINTGGGTDPDSFIREGEHCTLDAAVEDDASDEAEEKEFVEPPEADRSDFVTDLGMDPAEDEGEDLEEDDDAELAESDKENPPNEEDEEKE